MRGRPVSVGSESQLRALGVSSLVAKHDSWSIYLGFSIVYLHV